MWGFEMKVNNSGEPNPGCRCLVSPPEHLDRVQELGLDSRLGEVSILVCQDCGRHWLRYLYEFEAISRSGRWYLGPITSEQLAVLNLEQAKTLLEELPWYYYGGSYFGGQSGKASGEIRLGQ
jgi:hypothetical protein